MTDDDRAADPEDDELIPDVRNDTVPLHPDDPAPVDDKDHQP
jgi:hypothetical protein